MTSQPVSAQQKSSLAINLISIAIPLVVAILLTIEFKIDLGAWTKILPHVIGGINTLTSLVLILGILFLKAGRIQGHRYCMLTAFGLGAGFLVCYVTYHLSNPSTRYGDAGLWRTIYLVLLLSHIALSILVLPLVLRALFYALTNQFDRHRRVAKYAFPIWLYVSVSGVLVYAMISPYYAKSASAEDEDEAAMVRIESPFGEDPGQRQAIAASLAGTEGYTEEQWLKSFRLTERSGKTIGTEDLKGQPFIASFFFSKCPGSCKQQNDQMRLLQQKYRDSSIRLVSISVDPENDTPEVLDAYANGYGADKNKWLFFTGDIQYITRMAAEVFLLGQVGLKSHPDRFCLFDANGKLVGKYNWHEPKELKQLDEHVRELLSAK